MFHEMDNGSFHVVVLMFSEMDDGSFHVVVLMFMRWTMEVFMLSC